MQRVMWIAALCGAVLLNGGTARAEEGSEEAAGPNTGKIGFSAGFDVTTEYLFRGIFQEDQGLILQPWFEASVALFEFEGPISSVDFVAGMWNSIHDGPTGSSAPGPGAWYEADVYAGFKFGLPANFSSELTYTYLGAPDPPGSIYAEEFSFSLAYDDSELWNFDLSERVRSQTGLPGFGGLQPYVTYVIEVDGASDGVGNGGDQYLEIGIGPQCTVLPSETMPVTLTVPLVIGLSVDDYYESPIDGDDEAFGFLQVGLDFSVPLWFVPADYGSWSAHAGVNFFFLGDTVDDFNDGDDKHFEVIGVFGVSMEY